MASEILFCTMCKRYTIEETCTVCNAPTVSPKPAKYSPEDRYGHYRRLYKQQHIMQQSQ